VVSFTSLSAQSAVTIRRQTVTSYMEPAALRVVHIVKSLIWNKELLIKYRVQYSRPILNQY
jgi:hypothetical protein